MSLVTVRVVTSDRVIHTFDSLTATAEFNARRAAIQQGRKPRGSMRADILQLLADRGAMVSLDIADEIDTGPDTLNGVLRRMVDDCVIAIDAVGAYGRRSYRIEPNGHAELAALETGIPSNPRNRLQHQAHLWMTTAGRRFCSKDLEAAFGFSCKYANERIHAALAKGAISPADQPVGTSRRIKHYQAAQPQPTPVQEQA